MSQKTVAAVLLLVASALGGPVAVKQSLDAARVDVVDVVIVGPSDAVVGELVKLSIDGDLPSWLLPTDDAHIDKGTCYISFRKDGRYEVIGSSLSGGKIINVRHSILVGLPPAPLAPPSPLAPLAPLATRTLSDDVADWASESSAPKAACRAIGKNFATAVSQATSTQSLLTAVSALNRETNQAGCEAVLAKIQRHIFENVQGKDLETHKSAFSEIGSGLISYADRK